MDEIIWMGWRAGALILADDGNDMINHETGNSRAQDSEIVGSQDEENAKYEQRFILQKILVQ
ncbi:MAG: hypothetical protein RIR96_1176 [Bacteroidota bacterium]